MQLVAHRAGLDPPRMELPQVPAPRFHARMYRVRSPKYPLLSTPSISRTKNGDAGGREPKCSPSGHGLRVSILALAIYRASLGLLRQRQLDPSRGHGSLVSV